MDLELVRDKICEFLSKRETADLRFINKFHSKIPLTIDLTFLPKSAKLLIHNFILEYSVDSDINEEESEFMVWVEDCSQLASASELRFRNWRSCTWKSIQNQ